MRRSCETAAISSRRIRSASSITPVLTSCTERIATTSANAVTAPITSASWAETNISATPAPTTTASSASPIAIPSAIWRRGEPSRRRRARATCAAATAGAPRTSSSRTVSAASPQAVDDADQRAGGERGGEHEQRGAERPAHGWYRYPTPHTVCTCFGCAGSASIFARSRRTWTVTVEVSE